MSARDPHRYTDPINGATVVPDAGIIMVSADARGFAQITIQLAGTEHATAIRLRAAALDTVIDQLVAARDAIRRAVTA